MRPFVGILAICTLAQLGCATTQQRITGSGHNASSLKQHSQTASSNDSAGIATRPNTLGPGDEFAIRVYDEEELSGAYRISAMGAIDFPLIGRLTVANLTSDELARLLEAKLSQFVKKPQVSVLLTELRSQKVYVFGFVKSPGTFQYEPGMNIIQAITLAGGFETIADKDGILVNRTVEGVENQTEISVKDIGKGKAANFDVKPGDIIYVPESLF